MPSQFPPIPLLSLFRSRFGCDPESIVPLPGAGSDREYFRLSSPGVSVIGTLCSDQAETRAFVSLSRLFHAEGLPVPEVMAVSADNTAYLQQDLGSVDLLSLILKKEDADFPERVMEILPRLQTVAPRKWGECVAFPPMSRRLVGWDLNYFKYEFLKPSGVAFDEERLENDFERLAEKLLSLSDDAWGFMWRDCQSRNVMVSYGNPYFIDFQGGRRGPGLYDAVSFAWQARAGFSPRRRELLIDRYMTCFSQIRNISYGTLRAAVPDFVIFRTLQVLGAYGFRGLVERKAHFLQSIPAGIANLREILDCGWLAPYPELERAARGLCGASRFQPAPADGRLHIKVFSFSYKKGYPDDFSGNGGGFMFDCRGMHNPGRYDEFKPLTGLDRPVRDFLEERGEIQKFIENAFDIVSPSVETYLRRGFSSLQVGFGCTGGRHRSVYAAQALAERLAVEFPQAVVDLLHREQRISRTFNSSIEK